MFSVVSPVNNEAEGGGRRKISFEQIRGETDDTEGQLTSLPVKALLVKSCAQAMKHFSTRPE